MKPQIVLKKLCLWLVIGFVSALAFSACKSTGERPAKSEHPEHPK
jgi:hypothetical protein